MWIRANPVLFPCHPLSISNSSSLMEMGCREEKMRNEGKIKRKRNSQGKDPATLKETSREGARVPPSPKNQSGKKEEKCIPEEECT